MSSHWNEIDFSRRRKRRPSRRDAWSPARGLGVCVVLACIVLCGAGCSHEPSARDVLALRDTLRTQMEHADVSDVALRDSTGRDRLRTLLQRIIPSSGLAEFSGPGELTLSTLGLDEICWNPVLGLQWRGRDERSWLTVTTRALLHEWQADMAQEPDYAEMLRLPLRSVLESDALWNVGRCSDAAFVRYCDVPIVDTTRGVAFAMLGARMQDVMHVPPNILLIAAVRGDRVFLLETEIAWWPASFAPCDGAEGSGASEDSGEALDDDGGMRDYADCMGRALRADARFGEVQAKVDRWLDALPVR